MLTNARIAFAAAEDGTASGGAGIPPAPPVPPLPPAPPRAPVNGTSNQPAAQPADSQAAVATFLREQGIAGQDELRALLSLRARVEAEKPDAKAARQLEAYEREVHEYKRQLAEYEAKVSENEAKAKAAETKLTNYTFQQWLASFAGGIADALGVSGTAHRTDLRHYVDRCLLTEGDGTKRRMVFEDRDADQPVRYEAKGRDGEMTPDDMAAVRELIMQRYRETRPTLIDSRARSGAGTMRSGAPRAPMTSPLTPGTQRQEVAQDPRAQVVAGLMRQPLAGAPMRIPGT
ncbi:MAG: hypothetical protein ABII82_01955 [Verrucomicrobiota bacterium]